MSDVAPNVAYIAEGKLYTQAPAAPAKLIESPFVQGILDRVERDRERGEWKNQGMAWNFGSQMRMPFGSVGMPVDRRRIRFSGVTSAGDGKQLLYSLDTDHVGGLFQYELADGFERRLYHRQQLRINDVARHRGDGTLVFSMLAEDGTAHIGMMGAEGKGFKGITAGDAVDEAPSWVIGETAAKTVVFQSAGVGRDQGGFRTSLSTYAIMKLDVESGKMETLIEEDASDALLPQMTGDGTLWFIRRPYEAMGATISPWKLALDMLLFPIRLAGAIVHFFNFFSLMFQRKPLITSGGPPREGPDQRYMMLWGKVIDAQKLQKAKKGESQALVPPSWQLVKRSPSGSEEVIAKRVLAYDLCPDGGVIYTDGSTIYHRTLHGDTTQLAEGKLIERIAVL
ncbi:MAG TPA: hypothetical protein VGP94_07815 [Tepidisphaeraceae bacterium]|nr:hypothetical protein [Tepidisphaeraceae bacterium]